MQESFQSLYYVNMRYKSPLWEQNILLSKLVSPGTVFCGASFSVPYIIRSYFRKNWRWDSMVSMWRLLYIEYWVSLYVIAEKAMAPHSSTLAWKIPWMEEPDRLQSMGSRRVGHDWATSLSLFTFMHWRKKWQPTPVFLPGESQGWESLVAAIYGVTQSRTQLKGLSSSRSTVLTQTLICVSVYVCVYIYILWGDGQERQRQRKGEIELRERWKIVWEEVTGWFETRICLTFLLHGCNICVHFASLMQH